MNQGKVIGFNAAKMAEQMMANAVAEQNRRLIAYAKKEIKKLGDTIQTYNSANHMDRTGNLLNSLCWGVTYDGKMVDCGFYRSERTNVRFNRWKQLRGMGFRESFGSYIHEWSDPQGDAVDGRARAEHFLLSRHGKKGKWTVFFAILAPYWGYWESGFTLRGGGGESGIPRHSRFMQFQVMTHIYDDVRMALKPATTHINVYVEPYSYKANSQKGRKYKNRRFTKKLKID